MLACFAGNTRERKRTLVNFPFPLYSIFPDWISLIFFFVRLILGLFFVLQPCILSYPNGNGAAKENGCESSFSKHQQQQQHHHHQRKLVTSN
jgi:hypothetical protein